MSMPTGLSRQILVSMTALVLGVVLLFILGSYAFYALLLWLSPESMPSAGDWLPSAPELTWIIATIGAALALAITAAIKLSRRILSPLISVADGLRQLAKGDLDARAATDDYSLGEAALLVEDFNVMAERLQRMAQEQAFWNAAIAHELRTPLTILRGRIQGLSEGVFQPDAAQFNSLSKQVEILVRLIEDLRVVGLADSGHLDLQMQETDLASDIRMVLQLFEPELRSAGLVPILDLEPRMVRCDPARIRQALLALVENARRHAVPGHLLIQAKLQDNVYRLRVEDDGPGIAADLAPHVFEAFKRGSASRTSEGSGSGLGLAVVRAIALSHGGRAICLPSPEGGTIFEISWPA